LLSVTDSFSVTGLDRSGQVQDWKIGTCCFPG